MNVVYRPPGPDELRSVGAVVAVALLQAPHSDESWGKSEPTWQACDTISAFDGGVVRRLGVGVLRRHDRAGRGSTPDRRDHPRRRAADASPPRRRQTAPGAPRRRRARARTHARIVAGDRGRDLPAVRIRRRRRERVRRHRLQAGAPVALPRDRWHVPHPRPRRDPRRRPRPLRHASRTAGRE